MKHTTPGTSENDTPRERDLDVEPERQAEVLPAHVVGQVEQELLPRARTRETVVQSPVSRANFWNSGSISSRGWLGTSTMKTSFLLPVLGLLGSLMLRSAPRRAILPITTAGGARRCRTLSAPCRQGSPEADQGRR